MNKPLSEMSFNDLLEEEWYMLADVQELFRNPKHFVSMHSRALGVFAMWLALTIALVTTVYADSEQLARTINDILNAAPTMAAS